MIPLDAWRRGAVLPFLLVSWWTFVKPTWQRSDWIYTGMSKKAVIRSGRSRFELSTLPARMNFQIFKDMARWIWRFLFPQNSVRRMDWSPQALPIGEPRCAFITWMVCYWKWLWWPLRLLFQRKCSSVGDSGWIERRNKVKDGTKVGDLTQVHWMP